MKSKYAVKSTKGKNALLEYMLERHSIYLRRAQGQLPPWTEDPILTHYKFCNVYRELDAVTQFVRETIREPYKDHESLWFMLCIARQINWPPTLSELIRSAGKNAWPLNGKWSAVNARRVMNQRAARGEKVYTGAYLLNAHGGRDGAETPHDKPYFTCHLVLDKLWKERNKVILPVLAKKSMQEAATALMKYHGWGGFTAYEVVCDLRYTRYLEKATDINTWANAGPGAVRGLNRIAGRPFRTRLNQKDALSEMIALHADISAQWPEEWPKLELREIEHSLCELDKYLRARTGDGEPEALFRPGQQTFLF